MRQTFSHLLTIQLKHRYFRDGLFRPIEFNFNEDTSKLINDLGIIIKPFIGGFNLLATDPELLDSVPDIKPLQFHIFCKDPLYINYTQLPSYQLTEKILYFNNLNLLPDSNNKEFKLNQDEFADQHEIIQVTNGRINISESTPDMQFHFTDAAGIEIASQCIKQSDLNSNEFIASNLPQGLIKIFTNDRELPPVYYYPSKIWQKPMGILELFPGKLFSHYKENGKVDYSIHFANRKTIWKYFLVSSMYQKYNNLTIINKGKEQIFNTPQKQQVYKNPDAWVIESKIQIPLSELSEEAYQLVDNYDPSNLKGNYIHKNLVKPTPEQLHFNGTNSGEPAYSHIYL